MAWISSPLALSLFYLRIFPGMADFTGGNSGGQLEGDRLGAKIDKQTELVQELYSAFRGIEYSYLGTITG